VHRAADTELYSPFGEIISNLVCVPDGSGKAVEFGYREGVAGAAGGQRFT